MNVKAIRRFKSRNYNSQLSGLWENKSGIQCMTEQIKHTGIKLNKEICKFNKSHIEYFGYKMKDRAQRKKEYGQYWKLSNSTCVSKLRHIIGKIWYHGQFLPNVEDVIQTMQNLLKKE